MRSRNVHFIIILLSINNGFFKLFDLSSTGLKITIVQSFFENFLEFLKKKKNTVIVKILKISAKSNERFTVKYFKFL